MCDEDCFWLLVEMRWMALVDEVEEKLRIRSTFSSYRVGECGGLDTGVTFTVGYQGH